jgi:hypothetical protein
MQMHTNILEEYAASYFNSAHVSDIKFCGL